LVSLSERFRKTYEPNTSSYKERIEALKNVHKKGVKTWVSIEPYPTPNIIKQDLQEILKSISFVDKIIFGRLNYNKKVSEYQDYKIYYNNLANAVVKFCKQAGKSYHIKKGTAS
jgi:DNA repair photolyase